MKMIGWFTAIIVSLLLAWALPRFFKSHKASQISTIVVGAGWLLWTGGISTFVIGYSLTGPLLGAQLAFIVSVCFVLIFLTWLYKHQQNKHLTLENENRALNQNLSEMSEKFNSSRRGTIKEIIQSGEDGYVEFKSTMRWNLREARIDKKMEEIILKSISAFSNSKGGKLLIGVDDSGEILGIQDDCNTFNKPNKDYFELHLRNLVNNTFGKDFTTTNVSINFPIVDENEICEIYIKAGTKALYLEVVDKNGQRQKKFYVRSGNSSQDLAIDETASYTKSRFDL